MIRALSLIAAVCLYAMQVQAHHGLANDFDASSVVEVEGVIESLQWRNPHVSITIAVEQPDGSTASWAVVSNSVSNLTRMGVTRDLLATGERVRVAGIPAREGNALFMDHMLVPDGREIVFKRGASARWDGETIGNSDRLHGKVATVDFEKRPKSLFAVWTTVFNDPESWPLFPRVDDNPPVTEEAKAIMAGYDFEASNPLANCAGKGMPSAMANPYPIEFIDQGNKILLKIEEYDAVREIVLAETHDDSRAEPSLLGYSTGRWEGDKLVVTTTKIDYPYLDVILKPLAIPQSEHLELVETFELREDRSHLDYEMTATDPEMLRQSMTFKKYFLWDPEATLEPYACEEG